jgi:hypothetical protein
MQCAPVKALTKSCSSKVNIALMDQLCSELLAPASATTDSKVGACAYVGRERERLR